MEQVSIWVRYEWDCPECQESHDEGDVQPSATVQCDGCGATFAVGDVR